MFVKVLWFSKKIGSINCFLFRNAQLIWSQFQFGLVQGNLLFRFAKGEGNL